MLLCELVEGALEELAFDETALEFVFVGFTLALALLALPFKTLEFVPIEFAFTLKLVEFVFVTIAVFAVVVFCAPVEFVVSALPQLLCQKKANAMNALRAKLLFIISPLFYKFNV